MAQIIKTNGEIIYAEPKNGKDFKLRELQAIVDGYIEIVWLPNDKIMVVNEDGKLRGLETNVEATRIYYNAFGYKDIIVGDVLLCDANQVE
jgi:hypothetical protein